MVLVELVVCRMMNTMVLILHKYLTYLKRYHLTEFTNLIVIFDKHAAGYVFSSTEKEHTNHIVKSDEG